MKLLVIIALSLFSTTTKGGRSSLSSCFCHGPSVCPSGLHFMEIFAHEPAACQQRLINTCGFVDASDLVELSYCMINVRAHYTECPPFSLNILPRMTQCRSCVQRCLRRVTPFTCHAHCAYRRVCPSTQQIFYTIGNQPWACRSCIKRRCGFYNSLNRLEVAICMYTARANCATCYKSPLAVRVRNGCQGCLDRCEASVAIPAVLGNGGGGFGRNLNNNSTNQTTQEGPRGREGSVTNMQEGNMTDVDIQPSPIPSPGGNVQVEVSRGREESAGQTSNDDDNIEVSVSETSATSPPIRPNPSGGGGRFGFNNSQGTLGGRTFPNPCNCFTSGRCPRLQTVVRTLGSYSALCRSCISQSCGNQSTEENRMEFINCVIQSRQNCQACPTLRGRILNCRSCIARCPEGGEVEVNQTPMPSFGENRTEVSCRRSCTGVSLCPNTNAILYAFERFSRECRNCATQLCETADRRNRDIAAECRFQARLACEDECDVNERELTQRESCKECLTRCATEEPEERNGGRSEVTEPTPTIDVDSTIEGREEITTSSVVVVG